MTQKNTISVLVLVFLICTYLYGTSNLSAKSNQATVPINITVKGKLVLTDSVNDNKSGENPTLNVFLKLTPDINNSIVSGNSAIRIRSNLNSWKLTAQRSDQNNSLVNIDPKDISITFSTQAGANADPNAGKLVSPFNKTADLSQISINSPLDLVIGNSKTSLTRDSQNKNNWFQLTSSYSISPDFFYEIGEWGTTVSYNLVR